MSKWSKEKSPSVRLWREYRAKIYDHGTLLPQQEIECSRAFYAGMMAAFGVMLVVSDHDEPEDVGAARLEGLRRDIAQAATDTL